MSNHYKSFPHGLWLAVLETSWVFLLKMPSFLEGILKMNNSILPIYKYKSEKSSPYRLCFHLLGQRTEAIQCTNTLA